MALISVDGTVNDVEFVDPPGLQGFTAWTYPSAEAVGTVTWPPAAGVLALTRFWWLAGVQVGRVKAWLTGAGAGLSNTYLGVYDSTGELRLASGTDISSSFTATGLLNLALSGAPTAPDPFPPRSYFYIGLLVGAATTLPVFAGRGTSPIANLGLVSAYDRSATSGSGLTALPSSFDPTALTAANGLPWIGLNAT